MHLRHDANGCFGLETIENQPKEGAIGMQAELALSEVVDHIYKSSYQPDHWPVALEHIARYTASSTAIFINKDNELERVNSVHYYNLAPNEIALYNSFGIDPNFEIFMEKVPIGKAAAVDHLVPDRAELEGHYGDEFMSIITETDTFYTGGVILFMDDVRSVAIGLQRRRSLGAWNIDEISRLDLLVPHLQQAINIQKEFARLQTTEQALKRGLDRMLIGLILFDDCLRPVYINPVASAILDYHPAVSLQNGKVYASRHEDAKRLHRALVTAINASVGRDPCDSSTALGLRHHNCTFTLPVQISPIKDILHGLVTDGSYARAVMCFSDPERSHPIEAEYVMDIYGLTRAEAEVAVSMANGMNPELISKMKGVAISTVRSQLKSIYNKLGVNHQIELVKLMLTGPFGQTH